MLAFLSNCTITQPGPPPGARPIYQSIKIAIARPPGRAITIVIALRKALIGGPPRAPSLPLSPRATRPAPAAAPYADLARRPLDGFARRQARRSGRGHQPPPAPRAATSSSWLSASAAGCRQVAMQARPPPPPPGFSPPPPAARAPARLGPGLAASPPACVGSSPCPAPAARNADAYSNTRPAPQPACRRRRRRCCVRHQSHCVAAGAIIPPSLSAYRGVSVAPGT